MSRVDRVRVDGEPAAVGSQLPRYMPAPEAAKYLCVSLSWLRKASRHREVPSFRIGARVVYDRNDLDEYVDEIKKREAWEARTRD